jgi:uncharacterized membrane protein
MVEKESLREEVADFVERNTEVCLVALMVAALGVLSPCLFKKPQSLQSHTEIAISAPK